MNKKIAIIGAGPCGLGSAKRLSELEYDDWVLFERESYAGGLAASFVDDMGFTWDIGGHILFSHYQEFDRMLKETCGDDLLYHQRKTFIKVVDSLVPYPFQNNLRYLPKDEAFEALSGLRSASGGNSSMPFDKWMDKTFGSGIVRQFMHPYNSKVWATDPSQMASQWIAERVSVINFDQALQSVLLEQDGSDWGPNNTFMYPLRGGTGEVFRRLANRLPKERLHYNTGVVHLDLKRRIVTLNNGSEVQYNSLINTMPLNELIKRAENVPDYIRKCAEQLRHSGTIIVGCAFKIPLQSDWCWMYFPEPNVPFNRVTNFAHYSPFNVPNGRIDQYSAFMCETSFSDTKPEEQSQVIQATWKGLYDSGLVSIKAQEASEYVIKVPYAYPVPTLNRDEALQAIQTYLMKHGVYSRGRFGAWLYELGNMDHSFKQGIDVVDCIVNRKEEEEWRLK